MTTTHIPRPPVTPPWADLAAAVSGRVVTPADAGYPGLATPWNVAVPSTPVAVVEVADEVDVGTAVRFARDHGLLVDVRATGHGAVPTGRPTLLVHTGRLDEVTIHPEGWARVGAGVRWERVLAAAAPWGLAPLCGSAPGVGVVGYLTGGGLGPVARTYGLASDHVRAFDVVTGDGLVRRATATQHPALFWALRGGKGAVGIVTAVEFDLLPLAEVVGGAVYFDGADTGTVLRAWARWCEHLPEAATTSVAVLRLPDLPGVPPPLAGRCSVAVRFAWVGEPEEGRRVAAAIDSWATPVLGGIGPLPYAAIGSIHADPVDPMPVTESALLLGELPAAAVEALLDVVGPASDCPQVVVEVRALGGAVARSGPDTGPVCHRDAAFALLTIGIGVPPAVEPTRLNADAVRDALAPWTRPGALPNFGGAPTPASVTQAYTPAVLDRLGSLAAAFDPDGVLVGGNAVRAASGRGTASAWLEASRVADVWD